MTEQQTPPANDGFTLNLAWNGFVMTLLKKGVYEKVLTFDQSKIAIRFFGSVPGIAFNGGRESSQLGPIPVEALLEQIAWLNGRNIGFNFTFNNTLADLRLLDDKLSNDVLARCHSPLNGVVCASPVMSDLLRQRYPQYRRYLSCIYAYQQIDNLPALLDDYDVLVLPEDLNIEPEKIESLPHRHKIEIILNSTCMYRCGFRDKHYKLIHENLLREARHEPLVEFTPPCMTIKDHKWVIKDKKRVGDRQFIFPESLPRYIKLGIRHFKFLDRSSPPDLELLSGYWSTLKKRFDPPPPPEIGWSFHSSIMGPYGKLQ